MSTEDDFRPDSFSIQVRDNGQLRLVWERDSGEHRGVVLDRQQLPAVLQELQRHTERAPSTSSDLLERLSQDQAHVTGLGFAPQADNFRLTAFVELPEQPQGLAISLLLSKADVGKCASVMLQWLEQAQLG